MTPIQKLLLIPLLLASAALAAPPDAPPKSTLPPVDQFKQDLLQSRRGFDLTLQNARFYAGWIPRGFITAMLRYRPQILPGEPLGEKQWQDGPWFREGMKYLPGITDWGAEYMADRHDAREALTLANWDFTGTARIGFGRFLGFALDPAIIAALIVLISSLRGLIHRRGLRREELAAMHRDHHLRGEYPAYQPALPEHFAAPPELPSEPPPAPDVGLEWHPETDAQPPLTTPMSAYAYGADSNAETAPDTVAAAPDHPEPAGSDSAPEPTAAAEQPPAPQQNPFTAFQACQTRAEAGNAEDQFQLATMFRRGVGVEASPRQARHWFQSAAEQGHAQAQYELARQLFHGIGSLPDEHAAAVWMEQAAQQGLTDAKRNLATLYARGIGVVADNDTALYWLRQAAEEHDADAAELMATATEQGWLGLQPDSKAAASWRSAAYASRD